MKLMIPDYSSVDYNDVAAQIGLKPKHMPMLVGSFLEESEANLSKMFAAIKTGEFKTIEETAHSIKGSAGNLRFNEVAEMAKAMEFAAKASDMGFAYEEYYAAIEQAIATIAR